MARNRKRAAKGSGSIRKRPDGRWEGRVTVEYNPTTKKVKQKSVYGLTQAEVRKKVSKLIAEIDEGTYVADSNMQLSTWLNYWVQDFCSDKKDSTMKNYMAAIRNHIIPGIGSYKLKDLNAIIIQNFYNSLESARIEGRKLSSKTVHNIHGVLCKALNQAVKLDMLKRNPCMATVLPRVNKSTIVPLTDPQVLQLIQLSWKDDVYGNLLQLIVLTGLRKAEAMGITWECVDFSRGTILINKQLQKRNMSDGGFRFSSLKNDRSRMLKPAKQVMELLKQQKEMQSGWKKENIIEWKIWKDPNYPDSELVFTTVTGSYLSPQTVSNHFKKLVIEMGIPAARVHDLRHSYAVISIQNGDDIKTVQENLGHSSSSFTLDVYGHFSDKMKEQSARRMEHYLESLMPEQTNNLEYLEVED